MALFKSQLATQVSGSIGGTTFAQAKGAMYMRSRGGMTNPNTTRQVQARAAFSAGIQAWNALTDAERDSWDGYAQAVTTTNKLGDSIHLSGQNWYLAQFQLANYVKAISADTIVPAIVTSAPSVNETGPPVTDIIELVLTGQSFDLATTAPEDTISTDRVAVVQFGRPLNAGKRFFKGPYTAAFAELAPANQAFATSTTIDMTTAAYFAPFEIAENDRIPIRIRLLYDDGRVSTPTQKTLTVRLS